MNLAACLCVFSSLSISFCRCGSQTTELYSSDERIKARYAVFLQFSGQCFKFLLRKPSVELAFLVILLIWGLFSNIYRQINSQTISAA